MTDRRANQPIEEAHREEEQEVEETPLSKNFNTTLAVHWDFFGGNSFTLTNLQKSMDTLAWRIERMAAIFESMINHLSKNGEEGEDKAVDR